MISLGNTFLLFLLHVITILITLNYASLQADNPNPIVNCYFILLRTCVITM